MNEATWAELFPDGRWIFYEGSDPAGFAKEIEAEFGFDPSTAQGSPDRSAAVIAALGFDLFAEPGWNEACGWRFLCPAAHLDAVYGSGRWPLGS